MNSTITIHDIKSIHVRRQSSGTTSWTEIKLTSHDTNTCTITGFNAAEPATITVDENAQPPKWQTMPAVMDVVADIEEYLDGRADCDQPSGCSPIPNEEMVLLCRLRKARKANKS